jgi:hypothetical protein
MTTPLTLSDLAYDRAFTFIPSQDPAVSMRFYLPIGNWLAGGSSGADYQHDQIVYNERKGEYRFVFDNWLDNRKQHVRVDGSGVIAINGIPPGDVSRVFEKVKTMALGPQQLLPNQVVDLLTWFKTEMGIRDFFDDNVDGVNRKMHPYQVADASLVYGGFLPKPNQSIAIAYPGEVSFALIPGGHPQRYVSGAFASLPTVTLGDLAGCGPAGIPALLAERKVTPRAVEAPTFCRQSTYPNSNKIPLP